MRPSSSSSSSSWHRLHHQQVPPQRPLLSSPRPPWSCTCSPPPPRARRRCRRSQPWSSCLPRSSGVLEHLDVDLAFVVVGSEGLDDEIIGVVAVSSHLVLEHVDHPLEVAGTSNLSQQIVQLRLRHEDTDVVEGSTEVVLVQGAILVDVHQLEAVLVHLDLLLGEASGLFILSLAHVELLLLALVVNN